MHHFNATDKPILKEAWQNIWWTDDTKTAVNGINGLPVLQVVGTFANPGEIVDMHYAATAVAPSRVLGLFGHRHAWTTNFIGVGRARRQRNARDRLPELRLVRRADLPVQQSSQERRSESRPRVRTVHSPASSTWPLATSCTSTATSSTPMRARSLKRLPLTPAQNGPLRFANQAFEAEMCILFGASVGDSGAMEQLGPPPDFAKAY